MRGDQNSPYVGAFGLSQSFLSVGFICPSWSFTVQLGAVAVSLISAVRLMFVNFTKGDNMASTVAKATILLVGTAFLGRP